MVQNTDTQYWNDSCAVEALKYAIARGATGATSNPVIVGQVLEQELSLWESMLSDLAEDPYADEISVAWSLIEALTKKGAEQLYPVFEKHDGKAGRLSIQTNAQNYRQADVLVEQGLRFDKLAKNIQVKVPATAAGITAIEELTAQGISINATVCFSVSQAIAVAEAVERGLQRAENPTAMTPVCTIMVGRVDDWVQAYLSKKKIALEPRAIPYAGVAVFKHAWKIFTEKGYKTTLLSAAYRHLLHWTELVGGGVIHTIPHKWQVMYNETGIRVKETIAQDIPDYAMKALRTVDEFNKAYDADGMTPTAFESYGASARTLRQFHSGYAALLSFVRDRLIPDPDK